DPPNAFLAGEDAQEDEQKRQGHSHAFGGPAQPDAQAHEAPDSDQHQRSARWLRAHRFTSTSTAPVWSGRVPGRGISWISTVKSWPPCSTRSSRPKALRAKIAQVKASEPNADTGTRPWDSACFTRAICRGMASSRGYST